MTTTNIALQTETTTVNTNHTGFYESAEHYFSMRKKWAEFINSDEAKPYKDTYGTKYQRIDGSYYLLYSLLRGKKGFECFNNAESFDKEAAQLKSAVNWKSDAAKYLAVFDGTINMDIFKEAVSRIPERWEA